MAYSTSMLRILCGLSLLLACAEALKFDLLSFPRHDKKSERCIRNFVARDTLVMVTSTISGQKGDGMQVNIHVSKSRITRLSGTDSWKDQGRCRKRVCPSQGCCRREEDGLHVTRRLGF